MVDQHHRLTTFWGKDQIDVRGEQNCHTEFHEEFINLINVCRVRRVELVIEPGQSLGLMIRGGVEYGLGIYVTGVDKDSVADRTGLSVRRSESS